MSAPEIGTAVVPATPSNVVELRPQPPTPRTHLIQPTSFQEVIQMSEFLARSGLVGSSLRGKPADVAVILLKGSELGVPPMTALAQIHVIDGRPSCSPELMRALAVRAGHRISFTSLSPESVTIRGIRGDTGEALEITWDMGRARGANLTGKGTWKAYPQAMLAARATSELVRYHFPELGIGYIPEELGATVDERGEVIEVHGLNEQPRPPAVTDEALDLLEALKALDDAAKAEFKEWAAGERVTAVTMTAKPELLASVREWLDWRTPKVDVETGEVVELDGIYGPADEPTVVEPAERVVTMRDAFPSAFEADGSRPTYDPDDPEAPF